jgi:hypothetical protein
MAQKEASASPNKEKIIQVPFHNTDIPFHVPKPSNQE